MSCSTIVFERPVNGAALPFTITGAADLMGSAFQAILGRVAAGQSVLVCGCRSGARVWPRLHVRKWQRRLICTRFRIAQHHAATCVFASIRYDRPEDLLSPSIFAAGNFAGSTPNQADAPAPGTPGGLTFSQFAHQTAAQAGAEAFMAANPSRPPTQQPTNAQLFAAWEGELRRKRFAGEIDAFEAARQAGCALWLGVVFAPLVRLRERGGLINGWWCADGKLTAQALTADPEVFELGTKRLHGLHGRLPPPYVVLALVEPGGAVRKFWLRGIWTDGTGFAFAASQNERNYIASVRQAGRSIFVPQRIEDLDRIATLLPSMPQSVLWSELMDGIEWQGQTPVLVEVQGFKPGANPDYDANLKKKLEKYRTLHPHFGCKVVPAWQQNLTPWCFRQSDWRQPQLNPGPRSDAAKQLVRDYVNALPAQVERIAGRRLQPAV